MGACETTPPTTRRGHQHDTDAQPDTDVQLARHGIFQGRDGPEREVCLALCQLKINTQLTHYRLVAVACRHPVRNRAAAAPRCDCLCQVCQV